MPYTATIAILRPREVPSRYTPDDVTLDYSDPIVIPVERRVSLQPTSSREQGDNGRFSVVSGWMLVTPAGMDLDLRDTDRVRHGDKVLSVIGDVLKFPHPIRPDAVHHVEAVLERVKG